MLALLAVSIPTVKAVASQPFADSTQVRNTGLIARIIDYFDKSNIPDTTKRIDFSFIGGPHFSSDTKFGLGVMAAGRYRADRGDTVSMMSDVSIYGDIASAGFALIGIRGHHIFRHDRSRLEYNAYISFFPTKFWGIGYEMGRDKMNESDYNDFRVTVSAAYLMRIANSKLFIGPSASFFFVKASKLENPLLWEGQNPIESDKSVGAHLRLDTRDNLTATQQGLLVGVESSYFGKWLGNRSGFGMTSVDLRWFKSAWSGGLLALRGHATVSYGHTPWGMLPTFGEDGRMRGYYPGRYRDRNEADCCLELRQHIWNRNGIVAWIGAGSVWNRTLHPNLKHVLPNFGVGYRWEFKKLTNVRLDFGIGKGSTSFEFGVNEAF